MSADEIVVNVKERNVIKKGLNSLRENGEVPAVLHNHGKDSIHLQGNYVELMKMYQEAGRHHPVFLSVGGKKHMALVKEADFEPTKQKLRHIVFQAIRQNEKTTAEIPLVFKEDTEIPAERAGLLVLRSLDYVEVEALPKDFPDELVVDPSTLAEVGDTLTVADIKVPDGVEIITEAEHGIASVEMPRDQVAEADAAAADLAEDAESSDEVPSDQDTEEESTEEAESEDSSEEGEEEKPSE
ncbi:MAG: 50S ribosomal protein L25 [Candidatus Saccharibacteria bacterium]|nr:50S ribosomal protein L25 [Candidatus Saccharibacteria bacterium]